MHFQDGANFPENQQKLVITCAPYGPEWMPSDFPEDIPVMMPTTVEIITQEELEAKFGPAEVVEPAAEEAPAQSGDR